MKLQVEVESGSFEKVIEEGIKSLTPDELKDIIKRVILEAFTKCEDFKNLLTKRDIYGYSNTSEVRLGPLAEAAVKNIDLEKELAPFKEKMVKALMDMALNTAQGDWVASIRPILMEELGMSMDLVWKAVTCLIWEAALTVAATVALNLTAFIKFDRKGEFRSRKAR